MLAGMIPGAALAQSVPTPPWEAAPPAAATARPALPVTLDFSLPAESEWLNQINSNPTLSPSVPASSQAEAALTATIRGSANELPPASTLPTPGPLASAGPITPYVYGAPGVSDCGNCGHCDACDRGCNPCNNGIPGDPRDNRGLFGGTGPVRQWLRLFCPTVFKEGTWSLEYGTQIWRSPIWVDSTREAFFLPQVIRIGRMMNNPGEARIGKGVFELLAEADIYPITSGNGSVVVGGSGLIRYHRVRNHRIVPYVQAGFGGSWTDAADPTLTVAPTDTNFNFITQVGMGSHIFLNKKWAIMTESSYTWIGNWGIGSGPGYHVLGGLIGITRYFK